MARRRTTPHPATLRDRIMRLFLSVLYFLALSSLIAWEYRDHLDQLSNPCEGVEAPPKSDLYNLPYRWFLDWSHREAETPVTVVAIPQNLEEIQNNICEGREYLADLLLAIATHHPSEVDIDKFYSPAACASSPQSTEKLIHAVQSLDFPVIIGESTDLAEVKRGHSCLVSKPQVEFASPNAHHGLTRLDSDIERLPLQWFVVASDRSGAKEWAQDSLAWETVKNYDPNFIKRDRLHRLLNSADNPFAHLSGDLPRQTSTELFCAVGSAEQRKTWNIDCSRSNRTPSLRGKIVVIGAEKEPDRRIVLGSPMWGFDLQAHYIDALLSGGYLLSLPPWMPLPFFALFIIVIEGAPTLFEAYRPHWRAHPLLAHAFPRRRYKWVIFWTCSFILGFTVLSLLLGYLPPLALFGDIFLVVVTRLLFFLAESVEAPLTHHESKGHPMTHPKHPQHNQPPTPNPSQHEKQIVEVPSVTLVGSPATGTTNPPTSNPGTEGGTIG